MALCGPLLPTLITHLKPEDSNGELLKTQIKRGDNEQVILGIEPKTAGQAETVLPESAAHDAKDGRILLRVRKRPIIASVFLTLCPSFCGQPHVRLRICVF